MEEIIRMLHEPWFHNEFSEATKEEQLKFIAKFMEELAILVDLSLY